MNALKSMLSDGTDNCVSSKRVITLLSFLMCSIAFMMDLFFDLKVDPNVFDSMMYITIAGLGFTASERFAPKNLRKPR
jgi:hypothetical protein